jgi:predicted metal-dependent hydrolase
MDSSVATMNIRWLVKEDGTKVLQTLEQVSSKEEYEIVEGSQISYLNTKYVYDWVDVPTHTYEDEG